MTTTGSFVINGTERVIVSQLHRSRGVFSTGHACQDAFERQAAVLRPGGSAPTAVVARLQGSTRDIV